MDIEQVSDKKGMDEFVRFPWKVYKGNPNWVPPLISEVKFILSNKNPFFQHAEAACFLARKNGEVVGRIAAIIDRNHINIHNEQAGFFGYFECLPDVTAAEGLLNTAATWLKERYIETMRGPMNPSTNDECGFLLEGFDSPPMIMMTYTPPYYLEYMEHCGMTKAKDLFAYIVIVNDVAVVERLERLSQGVKKRIPGLTVRPASVKEFERDLEIVKDIYNSAWSKNWGFVPMTDEEIDSMAKRLKPLIVPELLILAEVDGKPAAFFMVVPDYNQVFSRLDGKLFPFGIFKFLWYSRKVTDIRGITLGVKEEYRRKGIEALLYLESFRAAKRRGYQRAEMSWILEDNTLVQKGCDLMGGKLYKKYRIYEKRL
ncbi:MAG: N-acetyltransferase family protein [Betaproteobacteria bacterium]